MVSLKRWHLSKDLIEKGKKIGHMYYLCGKTQLFPTSGSNERKGPKIKDMHLRNKSMWLEWSQQKGGWQKIKKRTDEEGQTM